MNWDKIFWIWFSSTLLIVVSAVFIGISLWLLLLIQILLLVGFLIERVSFRETTKKVGETHRTIYDFWLKTKDIEPKITVKKWLLDRFK